MEESATSATRVKKPEHWPHGTCWTRQTSTSGGQYPFPDSCDRSYSVPYPEHLQTEAKILHKALLLLLALIAFLTPAASFGCPTILLQRRAARIGVIATQVPVAAGNAVILASPAHVVITRSWADSPQAIAISRVWWRVRYERLRRVLLTN